MLPQDTASDAATVVPAFLGVGVVHCPPVAVLELLSASERKCEYDEIFESALTVHRYDEVTAVERHTYWTPSRLIVAARDLCLLGHAAMLADGALILFARSVQFDEGDGAVRSGYTRAQLDIGGFILQPLTSAADRRSVPQLDAVGAYESAVAALLAAPACRLTFVARCDLRGSLATPAQNKALQATTADDSTHRPHTQHEQGEDAQEQPAAVVRREATHTTRLPPPHCQTHPRHVTGRPKEQ